MLPDSISEEKLKIDWKMEDLQAGLFWCRLLMTPEQPAPEWPGFQSIFNFSSEMELGNISLPLI